MAQERAIEANNYPACLRDEATRSKHFTHLSEIIDLIPKNGHVVAGKPFDWCSFVMTRSAVFNSMMALAAYDFDTEKQARLMKLFAFADSQGKNDFLLYFIRRDISGKNREFLFECLSDKSMPVRVTAANLTENLTLSETELLTVESLLALKSGEIRQIALEVIMDAGNDAAFSCAKRNIVAKNVNKRLAALDILSELKKSGSITAQSMPELGI